jgi:DNA-binding NtrC family response regulator
MTKRLLVVDDDLEMCSMLEDFLTQDGYHVRKFMNPLDALNYLKDEDADAVITDLNMPEMSGLEVTRAVKEINADIPVLLITAFGTLESAIEAMQAGASDYVIKPFNLKEMKLKLIRVFQMQDLKDQNQILRGEIRGQHSFGGIIGKSPAMLEIFDLIRRVSDAMANVLINGESGTGKEQVARAIHQNGSRAAHAFVAINCTAIPESLMESELFGHARGSFTGAHARKKGLFEEAEGGTLFLDEIGDMDLSLQSKLLRVLQERKIRAVGDTADRDVDVRVIAATHKDLKTAIKNGGFREDLYYRLNVIPIVIPPLRHRREDIPLLAESFLKKYAAANNSHVTQFTQRALTKMMAMPWEGNVRELENCIERAVVLCRGHLIDEHDLPMASDITSDSFFGEISGRFPTIEEFEKKYIKFILDKTGGKKEKAAQILGMNRRTLYRKEREYGFVSSARHTEKRPTHH